MAPRRIHDLLSVGPVLADRILRRFGGKNPDGSPALDDAKALAVVRNNPQLLTKVKGIGRDKALTIHRVNFQSRPTQLDRKERDQEAATRIADLPGVGEKLARTVIDHLGRKNDQDDDKPGNPTLAFRTVASDPYNLLSVPGISYQTARKIAVTVFDVDAEDPSHNMHGNQFVLRRAGGVLPLKKYLGKRRSLGLSSEKADLGIKIDLDHAWLLEEHSAEQDVATWARVVAKLKPINDELTRHDQRLVKRHGLNKQQTDAVESALKHPAFLLTGGAGTGKTTTVAALIDLARKRGYNVHVMTLAGKSAERVAQACQRADIRLTDANIYGDTGANDADKVRRAAGMVFVTTIHRGLRARGDGSFMINRLAADFLIMDEASMIPNALLAHILQRKKPNTHIVMVGDPAQLPPIGFGSPFEDLLQADLPHLHLTENYRQADQESIHTFATAIRTRDKIPFLRAPGVEVLCDADPTAATVSTIEQLGLADASSPRTLTSWQVITSTNKIRTRLNAALQGRINPNGEILTTLYDNGEKQTLRAGDKVVVIRNDYDLDIMNGQTGWVVGRADAPKTFRMVIEGRALDVPIGVVFSHIRLGYGITVHKAQGSSWETVLTVEPGTVWGASNRLYYTAATRAERQVVFITGLDRHSWWSDVIQNEPPRNSTLHRRLLAHPAPRNASG